MASGPPEHRGDGQDPGGLDDRQRKQLVTLGLLVVVAILVLAFILENRKRVEVSFVVFTARTSLIWLIILSLVAGAVAGLLVERMVRRRFGRKER
ncbi:MAG: LapA family protein [Actinomycetota bacterium]